LTAARKPFGKDTTAEEVTAGLSLTGKTVLIAGSTSGIGYETMRVLVMRGAHVYGLGRSIEQAEKACAAATASGVKGTATPFACEQTDFSSVVACAEAVRKLQAPIDVLICNAGVYHVPKLELAEGLEKHFVINHLSHFILVNRLIDRVKSAKQGRIVVVGSDAAFKTVPEAGIEFDNLSGQHSYDPFKTYGQSKLANGLFARELAHRLLGTHTTSNVLHPGWVMTNTMHDLVVSWHLDPEEAKKAAKTPEQGAATVCYVATDPALRKVSGEYFEDCKITIPGGHMRDDAMAAKLWAVSEELTRAYLIGT
jgi:NAD(P)-dependent dehydrogenase (short-subunit alcohol dehydrogenase family)